MKFLILVALLGLANAKPRQGGNILDVLAEMGQESALELIELAGLTDELSGPGPFTAWVPKQEVFDSLPQDLLDQLLGDPELLVQIITFHVTMGEYMTTDFENDVPLDSLEGTPQRLNMWTDVNQGGSSVTVAALNGIPVDMNEADYEASNGVIHFLDYIILNVPVGNMIEQWAYLIEVTGDYSNAYRAAEALDLFPLLEGSDGSTLLIPSNAVLTEAFVDDLLENDPGTLLTIMTRHAAANTYFGVSIGDSRTIVSVGTEEVTIQYDPGTDTYVVLNEAGEERGTITAGDVSATNGAIHLLDGVI